MPSFASPLPEVVAGLPADVVVLPLPLEAGDFQDAVELCVDAIDLQHRGLALAPAEGEGGLGLQSGLLFRGVRFKVTSYFAEGPHYFMVAIDLDSAVAAGEPLEALTDQLLEVLAIPAWARRWECKGLDSLFHRRADEQFARLHLGSAT